MPKSILIDATHLGTRTPTGVEVYVDRLLPLLAERLQKDGWRVGLIGHAKVPPVILPKDVEWVCSPHARFWGQLALPRLLNARKPDLFFTPSGAAPLRYKGKTALTVHDMAAYLDPASFSMPQRFRLKRLMGASAKKAAAVLVPSAYTLGLVEKIWNVPPGRIPVIPHGYEAASAKAEEVPGLPDGKVILYVGRIERKKNLAPLIKGFSQLDPALKAVLVLAGGDGYGARDIRHLIAKLPAEVRERVILPGYVSAGQKDWLYGKADAAACPCPVEGFGIPALEAFAAKVPVLAAQGGSLPEVAGDAALYAQADIPTDWRLRLQELLSDDALQTALKRKGSERLKGFTWERTVGLTAEALGKAVA